MKNKWKLLCKELQGQIKVLDKIKENSEKSAETKYKKANENNDKQNEDILKANDNTWRNKFNLLKSEHKKELSDCTIDKKDSVVQAIHDTKEENTTERKRLNEERSKYNALQQELIDYKHDIVKHKNSIQAEAEFLVDCSRLFKGGLEKIERGLAEVTKAVEDAKVSRGRIDRLEKRLEKQGIFLEYKK